MGVISLKNLITKELILAELWELVSFLLRNFFNGHFLTNRGDTISSLRCIYTWQ
uniref:Uncharacterized protein n=1 Tax=Candidatus Kentrum sp. SD TaxID=2126332 RepID=A0A450YVG8_9GAMM|nr:MAG: hypothetical protein BECKSD772F_GA0070984_12352 [Candidatus Kentron sp. SD]VFK49724.1 MAG: hypothetical protein BECKSD772E_GA0070983_12235 [Candidatus Kentron sp. SD]VFK80965.1 MAG: hypothetical protein BECKSD772D_GA0070982_11872 [Candidatus Kentron sp. SD]